MLDWVKCNLKQGLIFSCSGTATISLPLQNFSKATNSVILKDLIEVCYAEGLPVSEPLYTAGIHQSGLSPAILVSTNPYL